MTKFFVTLAITLVASIVLMVVVVKVLAWWARKQRAIERQSAEMVEDVIEAKKQRIEDEVRKQATDDTWDEFRDRFGPR